ncbi:MAG TPA: helix-turn-helix transcriptional regulator [Longimicrobium sp.]
MSDETPVVELGSGNLWADIGRPDAEEALARAELMSRVTDIIRERRLTQARAAEILGTNQPTVSDLVRGKLSRFSLERLIAFLNALDQDVEITVRRRPAASGRGARFVVTGE